MRRLSLKCEIYNLLTDCVSYIVIELLSTQLIIELTPTRASCRISEPDAKALII